MFQNTPGKIISIIALLALVGTVSAQGTRRASPPASSPAAASAQQAFERGDWEAAVRGFEGLVKAAPGNADYHLKLGVALYAAGRPADAVLVLRQALKLRPGFVQARHYLGASLAEAGQCAEALPLLKKDLPQMTNQDLRRVAGLAGVRCSMGANQLDEAVDFVRLLARDFPNDAEVLFQAVHVYSDLSLRASQELLFKAPSSYQVRLLNAEALETQERWNDAAAEYRAILATNPNLPGIHYRLGRLLLSLPENAVTPTTRDEARREFEDELKINPRNAGAEYVLGELARQARDWAQAVAHFSNAAKLDPAFADAFIGLGRSLVADRKFAEAVAPLEHAAKLQPDNPATHYHLAVAYSRTGRKAEAERESATFRQTSDKARQAKQEIQTGVLGPQKAEP
ncbi:MAG TPA: tetratricopeptide repeat protein [Blastocatellia bacterium]|nr:tetratricopeptide repeat protein [Blastocatellia bacterium]